MGTKISQTCNIRGVTFPILVIFSLGYINRHVVSINDQILKEKTVNFINTKKPIETN